MQAKMRDHSIDHMRALAAALVFYWHAVHQMGIGFGAKPQNWLLSLFEEGSAGVTLFIAITGFIFTVITADKDIIYLKFIRNRVLRIIPLMFIIMLFNVTFGKFPKDGLFLFINLLGGGLITGAWTLAVEFQFYVAYPYLRTRLLYPSFRKTLLACAALSIIFLFFRYCHFLAKGEVQTLAYWTIFGQIDAFIAGIVGGLVFLKAKTWTYRHLRLAAGAVFIISAAGLIATMTWFNNSGGFYQQPTYPSKSPIWLFFLSGLAVVCGTMISSYAIMMQGVSNRMSRWVGYIGEISYSTYLLHFLTLGVLNKTYAMYIGYNFTSDTLIDATIKILIYHYPLTLLLSALSYEIIEKSFQHKTDYLKRRPHEPDASVTPSEAWKIA